MIKSLSITLLLFFLSLSSFSQNWITDFEEAKQTAREKDQSIVLVFSGSDWCAPCIKLEKEIWESETFKTQGETSFVMLRADFPRRKKNALTIVQREHNNNLASIYNSNGFFPLVVVLNKNGEVLGEMGYKKITPLEYINILKSY